MREVHAVYKALDVPGTFVFPLYSSHPVSRHIWTHRLFPCAHIQQEEMAFSLSVIGNKYRCCLFLWRTFVWNARFIKFIKCNKTSAIWCWDRILGARSEFCICSLDSGQSRSPSFGLIDSSWGSHGFAHGEIRLSDQMVKLILKLLFLGLWHQRIGSCFAKMSSLYSLILPLELWRYFTVRAEVQNVMVWSVHRC